MERQRNAPASREKDNIFSFYPEGNQRKTSSHRNLEMVIAFYPYFFLIPATNALRGLCCSLIVMVQPCIGYVRRVTHVEIADAVG